MKKITIFSKNNCIQCQMTKKFLEKEGVDFEEINLDEHPDKIEYVKNLGFSSAPVVQTENMIFSGFQPSKLKSLIK